MGSWTTKHAPKRRSDIVGNEDSVNEIIAYLNKFRNPRLRSKLTKKALLLVGPPGIGKTSSVLAIANGLNFDVVAVNASDKRNKLSLQGLRHASLFGSLKEELNDRIIGQILLVDEIDGLSGTADRGGIREIIDIIEKTRVPMILTANDVSSQKFKSLIDHCTVCEFYPPKASDIVGILSRICKNENLDVSKEVLIKLSELSLFDIRGSINSLQSLASGRKKVNLEDLSLIVTRDTSINIREFLHTLFVEANGDKAYQQTRVLKDVDYGKLLLILRDVSYRFTELGNYDQLANIYDLLARADVALARAQRERVWSQLVYFYGMLTKELADSITPAPEFPAIPDWKLQVPSYWITLSRQRKGLAIAAKVGQSCLVSRNDAINYYFPYLRYIFSYGIELAANLAIEFQLFDVEPGVRKTKIVWNGEIDYFCKEKEINRLIKNRIKELYPQVPRIVEKEVDSAILEKIKSEQNLIKTERQKIKTKARTKKSRESKPIKNRPESVSKPNKKNSSNQIEDSQKSTKESSKKSLTDFF